MQDNDLITALAKEGLWASQIGYKFNLTALQVLAICTAAGVEVRSRAAVRNRQLSQVRELLTAGSYSTAMICDKTGCTKQMVFAIRKELSMAAPVSKTQAAAQARLAETRRLVAAGMLKTEACAMTGLSLATYYKYQRDVLSV